VVVAGGWGEEGGGGQETELRGDRAVEERERERERGREKCSLWRVALHRRARSKNSLCVSWPEPPPPPPLLLTPPLSLTLSF
jgi:hypothetical protein